MNAQAFNRGENASNRGLNSHFAHLQVQLATGQLGTVLSLKGIPASMARHRLYVRGAFDFATADQVVGSLRLLLNNRIVLELPICGGLGDNQANHTLSILQAPQAAAADSPNDCLFVGGGAQSMRAVTPFHVSLLFDTAEVFLTANSLGSTRSLHVAVYSEF